MDSKPQLDRSLLFPASIGILSVIGICFILLIGRINLLREPAPVTPTETPFKYIYLGTEPAIVTPSPEETESNLSATPSPSNEEPVSPKTPTSRPLPSLVVLATATRRPFATSTPTPTPSTNTFDDTDFRLIYSGNWISQTNVSGAYQGTLHISTTLEDSVTFTFLGSQLRYFYQAGPSLGTVTIAIDGLGYTIDQSSTTTQVREWISGALPKVNHTVVLTHTGGGSVNLDSIIIPGPATATPTITQTSAAQ
jgi:hypothetical protein